MTRLYATTDVHLDKEESYSKGVVARALSRADKHTSRLKSIKHMKANYRNIITSQLPEFFLRKAKAGKDRDGNKCKVLPIRINDLRLALTRLVKKEYGDAAPRIRNVDISSALAAGGWIWTPAGYTRVFEVAKTKKISNW